MLRFPLAILVVFVHGFGADIDVSELHASGLTGLAVYDYVRLLFSVVMDERYIYLDKFILSLGAYFAIMKQDSTDVLWKWKKIICPVTVVLMVSQTYTGSEMGDVWYVMTFYYQASSLCCVFLCFAIYWFLKSTSIVF